jgi:hypothetical protein
VSSVSGVSGVSDKFESGRLTVSRVTGVTGVKGVTGVTSVSVSISPRGMLRRYIGGVHRFFVGCGQRREAECFARCARERASPPRGTR